MKKYLNKADKSSVYLNNVINNRLIAIDENLIRNPIIKAEVRQENRRKVKNDHITSGGGW